MPDDLIDAVNWAVKEGYADPKKIGIMGGSYGGYCALAAITFTPDVFACAVDIVGPSNLKTLIHSIPPYWKPMLPVFNVRLDCARRGCNAVAGRVLIVAPKMAVAGCWLPLTCDHGRGFCRCGQRGRQDKPGLAQAARGFVAKGGPQLFA
jgi:hypothetical protein